MGKTIEAGLILSELAERKLISSVLIVAASEENMINWKKELGSKFGLFQYDSNEPDLYKALVVRTEVEIIKNCTNMRPNQPMLMNITDFMKLNEVIFIENYIKNQLEEDFANDQISLKEYIDPFTGNKNN